MDGIEFILTAIVVSIYILIGSFWAWLIGIDAITLPWFAMVILWPIIGLMLLFIGAVIGGFMIAMLDRIFGGQRVVKVRTLIRRASK